MNRPPRTLDRLRILVTAGPTREYIDPVRYLSNESSGTMGFAVAAQAARRGHRVTLVHGPVALAPPTRVNCIPVVSAADMLAACLRLWPRHDVLVMAAAVADYRPARRAAAKIKKSASAMILPLAPTRDILATLAAQRRAGQVVIGFALEDRRMRRNAADKLRRKRLDAIVLNRPAALGAERSTIDVLTAGGRWRSLGARSKTGHARTLVRLAETLAARRDARVSRPRRAPPGSPAESRAATGAQRPAARTARPSRTSRSPRLVRNGSPGRSR